MRQEGRKNKRRQKKATRKEEKSRTTQNMVVRMDKRGEEKLGEKMVRAYEGVIATAIAPMRIRE